MISAPDKPEGSVVTTEERTEPNRRSFHYKVRKFFQGNFEAVDRTWKVLGAAGVIGTGIVYLFSGRDYDIDIWLEKVQAIYPSDATDNKMLPLSLDAVSAKSITFIDLNVSNPGKTSIGLQSEPWTLTLTGPQEATLLILGLSPGGSSKVKTSINTNPSPNKVSLQIGLLQPREYVKVNMIIVNAANWADPNLMANTSLKGLPDPLVNSDSPMDRAAFRIQWVYYALFAAALAGLMAFEAKGMRMSLKAYLRKNIFTLAYGIPTLIGLSLMLSYGTAWLLLKAQNTLGL